MHLAGGCIRIHISTKVQLQDLISALAFNSSTLLKSHNKNYIQFNLEFFFFKYPGKGSSLLRPKRALIRQKVPCSDRLQDTLTYVRYHLFKKRKNIGFIIFRDLQNGVFTFSMPAKLVLAVAAFSTGRVRFYSTESTISTEMPSSINQFQLTTLIGTFLTRKSTHFTSNKSLIFRKHNRSITHTWWLSCQHNSTCFF